MVFRGGERDLLAGGLDLGGLLSLPLSLSFTSTLVFSASPSDGGCLLLPLLGGEGGGLGLSVCVGLYRSWPFVRGG